MVIHYYDTDALLVLLFQLNSWAIIQPKTFLLFVLILLILFVINIIQQPFGFYPTTLFVSRLLKKGTRGSIGFVGIDFFVQRGAGVA
jgi:hypothetical protein